MSQEKLGRAVGLTFQQIQKYEKGVNRVSAGRLYQFSRILGVPVSFFFDEIPPEVVGQPPGPGHNLGDRLETEKLTRRETLELVCNYYRIPDPMVRKRIVELVRTIAGFRGRAVDF